MNNITIAGRVGSDAQQRYTTGGQSVCSFSVAVDNGKNKQGEKRDPTWFKCSLWGERGEKLAKWITKGMFISISGRAGAEKPWQNRDGEYHAAPTIDVNQVSFGPGGAKREGGSADPDSEQHSGNGRVEPAGQEIADEDIPF